LAPAGAATCDSGETIPQAECLAVVEQLAQKHEATMGRTDLQTGSGGTCDDQTWGRVPGAACSAQTGGDWAAHYKSDGTPENCVGTIYQLVCTGEAPPVDWRLCNSTVHSNLGNMGPDSGDSEIRYSNVGTLNGDSIDLVVTNNTEYSAWTVTNNGLSDCFGKINIRAPSTVTLTFRFVRSGTNDLVELHRSFLTIYDIDQSGSGMQEQISFNTAMSAYHTMPATELLRSSAEGVLTFTSTAVGNAVDNPSDPQSLTSDQKARAITVEYDNLGEYTVTFAAIGDTGKGRNFFFAGISELTEQTAISSSR